MSNEDSQLEPKVLKRLSMNTRLSAARIFEEENSTDTDSSSNNKSVRKMRSMKKDNKSSPYKNDRPKKSKIAYETDEVILERRQKQIDYGKNTVGYDNYLKLVPKEKRGKEHPKTPIKHFKYSRRGWDGLIKTWRQKLHEFDLDGAEEAEEQLTDEEDDKDHEDVMKELDAIKTAIDFM